MKTLAKLSLLIFTLTSIVGYTIADDHGHAEAKKVAGPNGGRVITTTDPNCEFLVTDDRKIEIRFLGKSGAPIPLAQQQVTVIGGDRSNPTNFTFTPIQNALTSTEPIPEGHRIPIIIQIKQTPNSKSTRERFNIELGQCPTCNYQEYACICGHEEEKQHDHGDGGHQH